MNAQPMVICPYCHAEVLPGEYIRHDLQVHGGLASMRDTHALLCAPYAECICRLTEYEAIAAGVR